MLPWNDAAVSQFENLRQAKTRVGTMDLKIACITLAHGATLLSRNRKDFDKIPGLRVEDWLS
ncbi:MAG: type II toxin-antitoxin system VapC family toxin [Pirellulales bacterium]|nr:type II toxin-antitoxin system VapC family toxin [Pirellulales bacterium]